MRARIRFAVLATVAGLGCSAGTAQADELKVREVGDGGLRSPRHLDFSRSGDLYVAEAGRGGDGPCFVGGEGPACFGPTGAVTRISPRGRQTRIVDGLASYANDPNRNGTTDDDGDSGIGPHGIAVEGNDVLITNGGPTAPTDAAGNLLTREQLAAQHPAADRFGRLLELRRHGRVRSLADIYEFERDANPDGGAIDTNPTDVLVGHGRFVISDAGGNSLLTARRGRVETLAVFPDNPAQAVPTAVVEGPDGAYYMSQLTGFPFPVGGANVYRVDPRTGDYTVYASGFTNIMDLDFDRRGTLYVLEIDSNGILAAPPYGAVHSVSRSGRERTLVPPDGTLTEPGGIAVGRHGDLFVTNRSRSPDDGQVLRIDIDR